MNADDIVAAASRDGTVDLGGLRLDLDRRAETLLVACSGLNPPGHISYAHEHTELEHPTSRLYVSDKTNRWYLGGLPGLTRSIAETLDLLAAIIARVPAARTIAVGTSMGGYLSLLLGGRRAVGNAVAFAPQTTVDAGWRAAHADERWADEIRAGLAATGHRAPPDAAAMPNGASRRLHVFYPAGDPLDRAHAVRLDGQPGVFLYPVATTEHTLSHFLKRRGVLRPAIAAIMDGRVPLDLTRAVAEDENDAEVASSLGRALLDSGDFAAAEAAFRRALAAGLAPNHTYNGLAHALWWQGRPEEALEIVASGAALLHCNPYAQYDHGTFLARVGRFAEAEACFRAAIWLEPRERAFCESLARLLVRQRRLAETAALRAEAACWMTDPEAFERSMAGILAAAQPA